MKASPGRRVNVCEGPIKCDVTLSIPPDSDALVCQRWPDRRGISSRTLGRLGADTHTRTRMHAHACEYQCRLTHSESKQAVNARCPVSACYCHRANFGASPPMKAGISRESTRASFKKRRAFLGPAPIGDKNSGVLGAQMHPSSKAMQHMLKVSMST